MEYELIITRTQPPCGGKSPQTHEIRNVSVDDPVAYVRKCETDLPDNIELIVHDTGKGTVSVEFNSGKSHVIYGFTED